MTSPRPTHPDRTAASLVLAAALAAATALTATAAGATTQGCPEEHRASLPSCASWQDYEEEDESIPLWNRMTGTPFMWDGATVTNACLDAILVHVDVSHVADRTAWVEAGATDNVATKHSWPTRRLADVQGVYCCTRDAGHGCDQSAEQKAAADFRGLCEWTWEHNSFIGYSCDYKALSANADNTQCAFSGVSCWDFVGTHIDNGSLLLTTGEIEEARNCSGRIERDGDCTPEPQAEPTDEEKAAQARADRLYDCEWTWKHNSTVGYSCHYASLGVDDAAERCEVTDLSCWNPAAQTHVDNPGTFTLTLSEIEEARNCSGLFTEGGDCSIHTTDADGNLVRGQTWKERRAAMRTECVDAWDLRLPSCRYAQINSNADADACHISEPILCRRTHGTIEIPNHFGKAEWTVQEIDKAQNCDGLLQLEAC